MRRHALAYAATALVSLAVGYALPRGGLTADVRAPSSAAATEELSEITARYARDWDARRGDFPEGPQRDEARRQWRKAYNAAVRDTCARRGVEAPSWAAE